VTPPGKRYQSHIRVSPALSAIIITPSSSGAWSPSIVSGATPIGWRLQKAADGLIGSGATSVTVTVPGVTPPHRISAARPVSSGWEYWKIAASEPPDCTPIPTP